MRYLPLVVLLVGCASNRDPIVIGHLVSLSGAEATVGERHLRGVTLAVEEVNDDPARHIAGRKVAVLHADVASNADLVTAQAVRLVSVNHVYALVSATPLAEPPGLFVTPAVFESRGPLFSAAADPKAHAALVEQAGATTPTDAATEDSTSLGANATAVTRFWPDESQPNVKAFADRYRKRYTAPPTPAAFAMYETTRLLLEVARDSKSFKPDTLREPWAKATADRPVYLVTVAGGQWKLVRKLAPAAPALPAAEPSGKVTQ